MPPPYGRRKVAQTLVEMGISSNLQEAFNRFLGVGGSCYIPLHSPPPEVWIAHLHRAGGKAFLAHPHVMPRHHALAALGNYGWDGVEAVYGRVVTARHAKWIDYARRRHLLICAGSDFHDGKRGDEVGSASVDGKQWQALVQGTFWAGCLQAV